MPENADKKNSEQGHFSHSIFLKIYTLQQNGVEMYLGPSLLSIMAFFAKTFSRGIFLMKSSLREKCPNTMFFLVFSRIGTE